MQFRFFRRPTRPREFEDEHEPNQPRVTAPIGVEVTRPREGDSEWLWWLSSATPEGALSGRGGGRGWSLDEPDDPNPPSTA
jgi:hypothetical protein